MSRLTYKIVNAMKDNAVKKAGINEARKALEDRDSMLTEKLRILSLGGEENASRLMGLQAQYEEIASQAKGYLYSQHDYLIDRVRSFRVNLSGANIIRKLADYNYGVSGNVALESGHPLVVEFYAIEDERKLIDEREAAIRTHIEAATVKITTVKRLLDVWPEAVELLPSAEQKTATPPAIQVVELNKMIGLPTAE